MEVLLGRTMIRPTDLDRTLAFYADDLGLAVAYQFGTGEHRGVVFYLGGGFLEIVGHSDVALPTNMALWLQVRSIEASLAELADRGVVIDRGAILEPWGLIEAWIHDPDGLRIHLVEVPSDHPLRRDPRDPATMSVPR